MQVHHGGNEIQDSVNQPVLPEGVTARLAGLGT